MMNEVHIIIKGSVQGVGFRYTTKHYANQLGLKGYVQNLRDGSVEICIQGSEDQAQDLLDKLKKELPKGTIDTVSKENVSSEDSYNSFSIKL